MRENLSAASEWQNKETLGEIIQGFILETIA